MKFFRLPTLTPLVQFAQISMHHHRLPLENKEKHIEIERAVFFLKAQFYGENCYLATGSISNRNLQRHSKRSGEVGTYDLVSF